MLIKNSYTVVKRLIARDKLAEAITLLHKHARDQDDENELLAQEARLNAIERSQRLNKITLDEYNIEKAKIRVSLLALSTQIFEKGQQFVLIFLWVFFCSLLLLLGYFYCNRSKQPTTTLPVATDTLPRIEESPSIGTKTEDTNGLDKSGKKHVAGKKASPSPPKDEGAQDTNKTVTESITLRGRVVDKKHLGVANVFIKTNNGQNCYTDSLGVFMLKIDTTQFPSGALFLYYKKGTMEGEMPVFTRYGTNDIEINFK